jgi:hypothetical protein
MSGTEIDRVTAATGEDDALIARAAKRTDLAGNALASAAGDLDIAHGRDGTLLAGLAEVIRDEAERISRLVGDIESHRPTPVDRSTREGV